MPTRELAIQVHEQHEKLRSKKSPPAALVIGGLSEKEQLRQIKAGARVIVATPGRLEDYMRRKIVDLRSARPPAHFGTAAADERDLAVEAEVLQIAQAIEPDRAGLGRDAHDRDRPGP